MKGEGMEEENNGSTEDSKKQKIWNKEEKTVKF